MTRGWMKAVCAAAVLCLTAMMATNASATLIGDEVFGDVFASGGTGVNLLALPNATIDPIGATVVDPGVEFFNQIPNNIISIDFDDSGLTIDWVLSPNVFSSPVWIWEFTDLDWVGLPGEIVDVHVISNTFVGSVNFSFTGDSITIITGGFTNPNFGVEDLEQIGRFEFDVVHVIPEPATLSLLGLGLSGLALIRRRRS